MNKKIPLVTYDENGVRKVVGEAVVTDVSGNLYARCLVLDEDTANMLRPAGGFSIGADRGEVTP